MNKMIFIVNPISGGGKALGFKEAIEEVCQKRNLDYEIIYTGAPKDASNIAKEYKNQDLIIYSVGGDGTLNEIVNGLVGGFKKPKSKLGVIPGGSGNDFYKSINLYDDEEFTCDLGSVNGRYFINVASVGLDSAIADNSVLMKKKKWVPKSQIYTAAIFYTLLKEKDQEYSLVLDKSLKINGPKTMVTVANGRYYGGQYQIAPSALIDDGLLDVYVIDSMPLPEKIKMLLKLVKSTHESSKKVNCYQLKNIKIESPITITANIDGESVQNKSFNIKIHPKAISIYNNKSLVDDILNYQKVKK